MYVPIPRLDAQKGPSRTCVRGKPAHGLLYGTKISKNLAQNFPNISFVIDCLRAVILIVPQIRTTCRGPQADPAKEDFEATERASTRFASTSSSVRQIAQQQQHTFVPSRHDALPVLRFNRTTADFSAESGSRCEKMENSTRFDPQTGALTASTRVRSDLPHKVSVDGGVAEQRRR